MLPKTCQVLIIGTGPTGLTLAAELLKYSVDFVIFDKLLEPQLHLAKGAAVGPRTREIFAEIDLSINAGLTLTGEYVDSFEIQDGDEFLLDGPYGKDTAHPGIICNAQYDTERTLRDYLVSKGVVIHRGIEVSNISETDIKDLQNQFALRRCL